MHGNKLPVINVLIAEDSEDDALLVKRELTKGGYNPIMQRVDSATQMQQALENQSWDLIIADHNMPSFDSKDALNLCKKHGGHTPFILVSGSIGEEIAVDAMKSGAHDYVMKNNLTRLLPAIQRELKEAENRRAHQEAEATIRYMAYHDSLTDLINRGEFERRLKQTVNSAQLESELHCLLYLDLDQFKLVNDSCGHLAGDELLKRITRRLQANTRESDTLARLGGDEFGVLLQNCPINQAQNIAKTLLESIKNYSFIWANNSFKVGVSIGLVQIDGKIKSTELLSIADMACYVAKDQGRNRIHIYTESDETVSQRRNEMQWIQRLQESMANDSLILFRQKIKSLKGLSSHYEILLRMTDDDSTLVTPDRFIPAAERYNIMPAVDLWVIQNVFKLLRRLKKNTPSHPEQDTYFINLSATSLSNIELSSFIKDQLIEYEIEPQYIGFEITETAAITDFDNAIKLISALQDLGCKVALDDFGTGMSSFSYLKSLNVNYVKIDGSFVKNMAANKIDHAIVDSINRIGHISGMKTIAEYVENDSIINELTALGVDFAQGWAIGYPKPFSQVKISK